MEKLIFEFLQSLGSQWLTFVAVGAWLVYKSGIVQQLVGARSTERVSERAQLSADQQAHVASLQRRVKVLEDRVDGEREECARQRAELRAECDRELQKLRDEISVLIRGEARWRHLVSNLAQYVAALQAALRKAGVEVPRFGGWETFIADGGDPLLQFDGE